MSGLVDQSADARSKTIGQNYRCRAWVNFNGTGTVAIRASGNVSSITDNGTGDYTVNFTTAMPDANYAFSGSIKPASSQDADGTVIEDRNDTRTTSSLPIVTKEFSSDLTDPSIVNVIVIR